MIPMLTKNQLPTPVLLLDLDKFEANLARMAGHIAKAGKRLRPHAKAHKCVEIARRQIAAGAIGVCVATIAEAELMSKAGIPGLLLTSPVADPLKMARIVQTGAMAVVDHERQALWYQEAARAADRVTDILVDLDVGDHRTGAASLEQALAIAETVDRSSHLRLRGLQAYSVHGSHGSGPEERARVSAECFAKAVAVRDAMSRKGLCTEILTGGSTGTWNIDTQIPELTELQAGSYVFMDMAYRRAGLDVNVDFEQALTVLATVISANHASSVSIDGGTKAFATDRGYGPEPAHLTGLKYRWGGDEFGYLELDGAALPESRTTLSTAVRSLPQLGEKLEMLPPHCDPTVNLYDTIYACRGEIVEAAWPLKRL
jgi:D-serine deaminase-like pyridoxal phosphate-dependent protein